MRRVSRRLERRQQNVLQADRNADTKGSDPLSKDIESIRSLIPIAVGMLAVMAVIAFLMKLVP